MILSDRRNFLFVKNAVTTKSGIDASLFPVWTLMSGILLLPFQIVKISIAQPAHLWIILVTGILVTRRLIHVTRFEVIVYTVFISAALFDTFGTAYDRVKASEQIFKFILIYPAFFLVGRWIGLKFARRELPFGWLFLSGFLAAEYFVQAAQIPYIWQPPSEFFLDVLYGTFLERNWLAFYFFGFSYLLFLKQPRTILNTLIFFVWCLVITALSGSKSVLIVCGIVLLTQLRGRYTLKTVVVIIGAILYVTLFSNELSGLNDRLEGERGAAFDVSVRLISENIFGYGFGFVEGYFSRVDLSILGLGGGANSVFSAPLDLFLIAGPFGPLAWAVFFAGLGLRSAKLLAPIAAWSLLAPLHQSELCYLFCGILVSWGLACRYDEMSLVSSKVWRWRW
jgi:hypothetical protein